MAGDQWPVGRPVATAAELRLGDTTTTTTLTTNDDYYIHDYYTTKTLTATSTTTTMITTTATTTATTTIITLLLLLTTTTTTTNNNNVVMHGCPGHRMHSNMKRYYGLGIDALVIAEFKQAHEYELGMLWSPDAVEHECYMVWVLGNTRRAVALRRLRRLRRRQR